MNFKAWISGTSGDFADFLPILFCCTVQYFEQWSNSVFIAINGFLSQINWSKFLPVSAQVIPEYDLQKIICTEFCNVFCKNLTGPDCISAACPRRYRISSVPIFTWNLCNLFWRTKSPKLSAQNLQHYLQKPNRSRLHFFNLSRVVQNFFCPGFHEELVQFVLESKISRIVCTKFATLSAKT